MLTHAALVDFSVEKYTLKIPVPSDIKRSSTGIPIWELTESHCEEFFGGSTCLSASAGPSTHQDCIFALRAVVEKMLLVHHTNMVNSQNSKMVFQRGSPFW